MLSIRRAGLEGLVTVAWSAAGYRHEVGSVLDSGAVVA
jgi:hypothetical protein